MATMKYLDRINTSENNWVTRYKIYQPNKWHFMKYGGKIEIVEIKS